jgi:hypothetical protein
MGKRAKRPGSGRHIDSTKTDGSSSSCDGDEDCNDRDGSRGDVSISIGVSMGAYGVTISTAYEEELLLLLLVVPMGSLDGMSVCEEE